MTARNDEPEPTTTTSIEPTTTAQSRSAAVAPTTAGIEAAIVTAEIPVVAPPPRVPRTRARPAYAREADEVATAPAPVGVRLVVWVLFFVFLVALIALAVEHYHPDWLSFMRRGTPNAALALNWAQWSR